MPGWPQVFNAEVPKPIESPWAPEKAVPQQTQLEINTKKAFGLCLAQGLSPFDAATRVIRDVGSALWASQNWLDDPIVLEAKDIHLKSIEKPKRLLDKEELAAKALYIADNQDLDAKDRIAALALYGKIAGYTDKVDINNTVNNSLKYISLKFVKPDIKKEPEIIDEQPIQNSVNSGVKIKLVKSA